MAVLAAGGWTVVEPIPMTAKQAGFLTRYSQTKAYEKAKVYMWIVNTTTTGHSNINALSSFQSHFFKT